MKQNNTKASSHRKYIIGASLGLLVLLAVTLSIAHAHRYIPGKITFQEYEPEYWPNGLRIKDTRAQDMYIPANSPDRFTRLYIEMEDGSAVFETERVDKSMLQGCPPGKVVNQPCTFGITSQGEPYLLLTSVFDGTVQTQMIKWSREDTDITVRLSNVPEDGYSKEEIEKIIKSFTKTDHNSLDVQHVDRSVI